MLAKYLILILLPSVAYCAINIHVELIKNGTDASVTFSGEERVIVSDNDRKVFKLDDGTLKRASEIYMGERCGDIYVKPPTRWGDVYDEFGWEPVRKTLKPISAKVIGINTQPVAFAHTEYINRHDSLNVSYSTSLKHEVEETVSHSWSQGGEFGVGTEMKFGVDFGAGSAGGSVSLSYSSSWGKETSKSRSCILSSTSTVLVVVPPKTMVVASLEATHGTMDIEMKHLVTLDGRVFCNYPNKHNGHHFYGMDVRGLCSAIDQKVQFYAYEIMRIGYFSNTILKVSKGSPVK